MSSVMKPRPAASISMVGGGGAGAAGVRSFDKSSKGRQLVWVSDAVDAFRLAEIVDILVDSVLVELVGGGGEKRNCSYEDVYAAEPSRGSASVRALPDDHCALMYLNPATLLDNTRLRYGRDLIYTYVANILIAVNPYKTLESVYTKAAMHSYENQSLQTRPPHVFAIGDKSYREMRQMRLNQSIIVSGESGSGKTESVKYILKYMTECYGQQAGLIEERIIDSNPLLEAFGNAKTIKNNNSSRFGKYLELHFVKRSRRVVDGGGGGRGGASKHAQFDISGGFVSHYLLERSRVCTQPRSERNYHIFYQLCARADAELFAELALDSPDRFAILSKGRCTAYFVATAAASDAGAAIDPSRFSSQHVTEGALTDIQLDDARGFDQCVNGMKHIGLSQLRIKEVLSLVAAIMHLGNVDFEEDSGADKATSGGCVVDPGREAKTNALANAARLLGIAKSDLRNGLIHRTMVTRHTKRDSFILVPLSVSAARHARDGFCKVLYARLFDYMVSAVNKSIPPVGPAAAAAAAAAEDPTSSSSSSLYIGILDIAGFEYMPINSFEQFCINYCNEKLQQFFNSRILKDEQALYEHEGLGVARIEYVDNQDCIDLIEGKAVGILSLLDEESRLPSPKFEHFTGEVFARNKNHARLDLARKSPLKLYRELRDEEGFMVRHFAGAVVYSTREFIHKNNDAIHFSLLETLAASHRSAAPDRAASLLSELFPVSGKEAEQVGKLSFLTVGSKFKSQLGDLLDRLQTTGTSFVRCIKPNELMKPAVFDGSHILSQLQCAGMLSVLELMQQGFPSRAKFDDLYAKYRTILPPDLAKLEPRFFCKALFHSLNMSSSDFKFGTTRVFFRSGKFAEFDEIMTGDEDDPESQVRMRKLVEKTRKWIGRARWRKAQYTVLSSVIFANRMKFRTLMIGRLQSALRRMSVYRRHEPLIAAVCRVRLSMQKAEACSAELAKEAAGDSSTTMDEMQRKCQAVLAEARHILDRQLGGGVYRPPPGRGEECCVQLTKLRAEISALESSVEQLIADAYRWADEFKRRQQEAKLRQLQVELEAESRRRAEQDRAEKEREQEARQRALIEQRRRQEVAAAAAEKVKTRATKEEEEGEGAGSAAAAAAAAAATQVRFQAQQTRLDHNLAVKLAAVTGSDVDPLSIIGISRAETAAAAAAAAAVAKYDLSGWRYAQLRDAINTSCDIELLEACREEFHRRLKAYHVWRAKNKTRGAPVERRIPAEMAEAIEGMKLIIGSEVAIDGEQRYFRVGPRASGGPPGAWYAHFDGKWICRQLQVGGGGGATRPLVAGVDDVQMCELRLDETDLTTTRGLEITEAEFERVWSEHGGDEYVREHYARVSSKWLQDRFKGLVSLIEL